MEEIEYKLKQNNAVLIVQGISKLIEIIKAKKNEKTKHDTNITELQFLKSKCGDIQSTISVSACNGIVHLVENGILPIGPTVSDLIIILLAAKCHTGIITAIGNLLLLDMRRELELNKIYKSQFNIRNNQHPLITVLAQNQLFWVEIFDQIQLFINHYDDKIALNSLEFLRPVFFYILCNPCPKLSTTSRKQLWNLLLKNDNQQMKLLTFEILGWVQNNSKEKSLELRDLLIETAKFAVKSEDSEIFSAVILHLTSVTYSLVKYGCDCTASICTINEILELSGTSETHSAILMILAEIISICSPVYLPDVLRLSKTIIFKHSSNILAVKSIVSSLLPWVLYPSILISESLSLAAEIISFIENNQIYSSFSADLYRNIYFKSIQFSDPMIDFNLKLCLMAEKWQKDEAHLIDWLNIVLQIPMFFLTKIYNFICAIFINKFKNSVITQKSLEILLKIVQNNTNLSFNVLVLILHKLTNETDCELQIFLLKSIPLMAVSKHNIPLIVNTLEAIKNGKNTLKTLSLELYFRLWTTEYRCFRYLHNMLLENIEDWEFGIVKANILKEICLHGPDVHGKEMVVYLSQILNKYVDQNGSIALSLALEGIQILCENGIVDIFSTWKSISPKFSKDNRPTVIKSLCQFLSQFANLQPTSPEQEQIINEAINKLWFYVSYSEYTSVIQAALKALSCFEVEQLTLKQLPDLYQQNLKVPAAYVKTKTSVAVDIKSADVLPYVPGECWLQLLQKINYDAMDAAGDLLKEWIRTEIATFKTNVYTVPEGRNEPTNYDYLPHKSIVRALTDYIRLVNEPNSKYYYTEYVLKQCLRILGENYSKPLPLINWTFLLNLFHKNLEVHQLCLNLLCKQTLVSPSARKIIENYISEFEPNIEKTSETRILFVNLGHLCKGISPNILRPMVSNSLNFAFGNNKDSDDLFNELVTQIKNALLVQDIHNENKIILCQIVEEFAEKMDAHHNKVFDNFVQCIIETSSEYVDRISSPSLWWETTQEKYEKALKIRCSLAKRAQNKPFVLLNECINTAAILPSLQLFTLNQITDIFLTHSQHFSTNDWLLELMGQIQKKLTNKEKNANEITFLCDVFLLAVIYFSCHECLCYPVNIIEVTTEARLDLFPSAMFAYISENGAVISLQIMEWLYHMINVSFEIPLTYRTTFYQALTMLRHEKVFCEPSKWMKYLSVNRPNNIT